MSSLLESLLASDNVTYIITNDLRIVRTNAAWTAFARANGGDDALAQWPSQASLLDVLPAPLRSFYVDGFARTAATREPWEHDYECSSPELLRRFRMIVYPFDSTFVVTHSLLAEMAHDDPPLPPADHYTNAGVIPMCSHCRRVRHATNTPERWDWVPSYVASPPRNTSHGLCPACARFHYGEWID